MEPVYLVETLHDKGECYDADVTSWVSVCPRGLWKVQRKQTQGWSQQTVSNSGNVKACSSDYCPRLGSLCRVRVQLKVNTDEAEKRDEKLSFTDVAELVATPFLRHQESVLQLPLGDWTTLRLGEGQCDITETCLEGMRAGEICEILLTPYGGGPDVSVSLPSDGNLPLCATVELQAFTPGKESWEVSASEKWKWVKSHKERGGIRFRSGDIWGATDSYRRALKLLIPLCGLIKEAETKEHECEVEEQRDTNTTDETQQFPSADEFRVIKAELHSNLSLCQLKLKQPERAKANATKATQLEAGAVKAWYRLGQACQMLNELEEAKRAFRTLLDLQPELPAAVKALKDITIREKERNAQLGLRLSKMFN
ncbi:FK506-binding protein-like [Melanotaenia boesemani]|uniref:FK506-binding protein-like n=1 Tax=Melanotaenia boesemani TaxID=1250792 RepID=UPI001C04A967|nr:FK506-binding protein-like [Melanotaenia boesemani]